MIYSTFSLLLLLVLVSATADQDFLHRNTVITDTRAPSNGLNWLLKGVRSSNSSNSNSTGDLNITGTKDLVQVQGAGELADAQTTHGTVAGNVSNSRLIGHYRDVDMKASSYRIDPHSNNEKLDLDIADKIDSSNRTELLLSIGKLQPSGENFTATHENRKRIWRRAIEDIHIQDAASSADAQNDERRSPSEAKLVYDNIVDDEVGDVKLQLNEKGLEADTEEVDRNARKLPITSSKRDEIKMGDFSSDIDDVIRSDDRKREAQTRDISYDYIFGKSGDEIEDEEEQEIHEERRETGGLTDAEKAEDLAISKELVDILIKEVYNKLLKTLGPAALHGDAATSTDVAKENKQPSTSSENIVPPAAKAVVKPDHITQTTAKPEPAKEKPNSKPAATKQPAKVVGSSGRGGGGVPKGKPKPKGKRFRRATDVDLLTNSALRPVVEGVETAILCRVLKRLVAASIIDNKSYTDLVARQFCFDIPFRRRLKRAWNCSRHDGCNKELHRSRGSHMVVPADDILCPVPVYVRRFPTIQYVFDGTITRNVSTESFAGNGGLIMDGLSKTQVNNNHQRVALQFTFNQATTLTAFRLLQIKPREKSIVESLTTFLELAGERDTWIPVLDSLTKQPLVTVIKEPVVTLPKPFTVTRIRFHPQSWQNADNSSARPVFPLPVFIACVSAATGVDSVQNVGAGSVDVWSPITSLLPVDRFDSWSAILSAIFVL